MSKKTHHVFIPEETVRSKKLNKLSASTRWLYVILVSERGGIDIPFKFPYGEIHKITGFSPATISKGVMKLVSGGFITYEHGGLEQNPNIYDMEVSWLSTDE